jgi:hypothetical protein
VWNTVLLVFMKIGRSKNEPGEALEIIGSFDDFNYE